MAGVQDALEGYATEDTRITKTNLITAIMIYHITDVIMKLSSPLIELSCIDPAVEEKRVCTEYTLLIPRDCRVPVPSRPQYLRGPKIQNHSQCSLVTPGNSTPRHRIIPTNIFDPHNTMAGPSSHPSTTTATNNPATAVGLRASRLHQVFDQALARTLRANSYANFSGCFPTPARHVPASLESVWRQLNAKLEESAKAEFEEILEERDAVRHLNDLDRSVSEAKVRKEKENENGEGGGPGIAYVIVPFSCTSWLNTWTW